MHEVSMRIRQRMEELRFSVKSLGDTTAIPRMTLTRRLADPSTLTLNELERIATALDTSPLYLATGHEVAA